MAGRIGHGMAAQANRLGVFLHTNVGRSGTQLRTQKADSCDPLAAILGADGSASGCRSAGTAGFRDSINPSTCFAMVNTWKHGISQVRRYDPYGPGDVAKYLSKGRFSSAADCEYANTYELRKFHRADWIYISPGAWAEMRHARTVAIRMSPLSS